ncbi:hypothetical protein N0V88_001946 [Collariella sp. IMI 366227]|nr:hypothetical protein N0V88_001946 [Collariella sp. IMI 366227]
MHSSFTTLLAWGSLLGLSQAACPYADAAGLDKRKAAQSSDFLDQYKVDDSDSYMTSDVGGPIEDQFSLKAGIRGSTLLEDFIFRQKIQHFDHERDGFGVHTFRFVKEDGSSKLIKWHFKTLQGKASLVWEEAQVLSGKNADFHRQDLWDAIESGNGPSWELAVQVVDEEKALAFGFDLLDPTKIIPEELAPLTKLGVLKLDRNPTNYFAETEQIMFQPGHIVRGIDFSEDPLLQGRLFSYLDTQLNRHGGPNFEQLPINMPRTPIHNNNRDGAGQGFIHKNASSKLPAPRAEASSPPRPRRRRALVRALSPTFDDHWSQPRLFYNSLTPVEQQFLINAIRFETSHVKSATVKQNVLTQLNRFTDRFPLDK